MSAQNAENGTPNVAEAASDMSVGSMFSGIGGLDLGLEWAGMRVIWQAETNPFCAQVLAKHWPHVPNLGDVRYIFWPEVPYVDVLAGGFPCQPVSDAGTKLAQADERWMWPEMLLAIIAKRPAWVVIENVPGLRKRGLDIVRADLDSLGYRSRPVVLSACELGAPHSRRRLFTLAHAAGVRCRPGWDDGRGSGPAQVEQQNRAPAERVSWWTDEPGVGRVAYGFPGRVDRVRALGNAVVPQIGERVGRRIIAAHIGPEPLVSTAHIDGSGADG